MILEQRIDPTTGSSESDSESSHHRQFRFAHGSHIISLAVSPLSIFSKWLSHLRGFSRLHSFWISVDSILDSRTFFCVISSFTLKPAPSVIFVEYDGKSQEFRDHEILLSPRSVGWFQVQQEAKCFGR